MKVKGRDREDGSALIFVLWTTSLLSAALLAATALVHIHLRSANADQASLGDTQALRSALDVVAFDIATIGRSHLGALPTTVLVGNRNITVALAPAQQVLDINMANDEQLIALFLQLGETGPASRRLADEILDWRDSDDRPRAFGAEQGAYALRQRDAPRNREYISVEELGYVLSVTPRRLACMAPYLTVLGGTPPPAGDSGRFAAVSRIDGVRVALEARLGSRSGASPRLVGLASFRMRNDVPYQWVSFGEDGLRLDECSEGAVP